MIALIFAPLERAIVEASAAEYCPDIQTEIQTDRPDVTNSSSVVPSGSLQTENGISLTAYRVSRIIDGTNSRIRLGVAHCTELLVDLPDYFHSVHGQARPAFRTWRPPLRRSLDRFPAVLCCPRQPGWACPPGRAATYFFGLGYSVRFDSLF
jgi:hypothetical protein